jgi:hypothetical protein
MDLKMAFDIILGLLAALGSWVLGSFSKKSEAMSSEISALRGEITELRVHLAAEYVTKPDLREILQSLRRIEDKLDSKADK